MEEHGKWLTLAVANLPATLRCRRSWAKDPKATWPATLRSSDLSTTSCTATIWDVYCSPSPPCTWPGKCLENFQAKTTAKVGQLSIASIVTPCYIETAWNKSVLQNKFWLFTKSHKASFWLLNTLDSNNSHVQDTSASSPKKTNCSCREHVVSH